MRLDPEAIPTLNFLSGIVRETVADKLNLEKEDLPEVYFDPSFQLSAGKKLALAEPAVSGGGKINEIRMSPNEIILEAERRLAAMIEAYGGKEALQVELNNMPGDVLASILAVNTTADIAAYQIIETIGIPENEAVAMLEGISKAAVGKWQDILS